MIVSFIIAGVFLLCMMYLAINWWLSIDEKFPLKKRPIEHILLKLLITIVFLPVVFLITFIAILGAFNKD